jgi:uncharacterized membrane protein
MSNYDAALERLIENGYEFKFNQYLNDGFELFKKNIGGFVGFYFIVFGLSFSISLVLGDYGSIILNVLQPALIAGAVLVANELYRGNSPDFSMFFQGFKYFLPLMLLGIVSSLLIIVGLIFLIVPGVYLAIAYSFANMFILFLGYEFWPAMELSRKIITKNWWQFFSFMLLMLAINVAGVLACGVGVVFAAPITSCMTYCAFEDIVGGAIRSFSDINSQPIEHQL